MSTYNARRGPNVSQYLRDLNAVPAPDTASAADEAFAMEEDLAMFTNTQFFDFDSGQNTDYNAPPPSNKGDGEHQPGDDVTSSSSAMGDFASLDFMSGDFTLGNFGSAYSSSPSIATVPDALGNLQSLHHPSHTPQSVYPPLEPLPQHKFNGHPPLAPVVPEKRSFDALSSTSPVSGRAAPGMQVGFEEVSRVAAEEDKRRRNTAASARFRVKKKQREQALEKSAKEMTDRVTTLENRIQQLETENKWLKNLITEKNESRGAEVLRSLKDGVEKRAGDTKETTKDNIVAASAPAPATAVATKDD